MVRQAAELVWGQGRLEMPCTGCHFPVWQCAGKRLPCLPRHDACCHSKLEAQPQSPAEPPALRTIRDRSLAAPPGIPSRPGAARRWRGACAAWRARRPALTWRTLGWWGASWPWCWGAAAAAWRCAICLRAGVATLWRLMGSDGVAKGGIFGWHAPALNSELTAQGGGVQVGRLVLGLVCRGADGIVCALKLARACPSLCALQAGKAATPVGPALAARIMQVRVHGICLAAARLDWIASRSHLQIAWDELCLTRDTEIVLQLTVMFAWRWASAALSHCAESQCVAPPCRAPHSPCGAQLLVRSVAAAQRFPENARVLSVCLYGPGERAVRFGKRTGGWKHLSSRLWKLAVPCPGKCVGSSARALSSPHQALVISQHPNLTLATRTPTTSAASPPRRP